MKQLLISAALAMAIHVFLLGMDPRWLNKRSFNRPNPRIVSLSLGYYAPEKPEPKSVEKSMNVSSKPSLVKKKQIPIIKKKPVKRVEKPRKMLVDSPKKISKPPKELQKKTEKFQPQTPPSLKQKRQVKSPPKEIQKILEKQPRPEKKETSFSHEKQAVPIEAPRKTKVVPGREIPSNPSSGEQKEFLSAAPKREEKILTEEKGLGQEKKLASLRPTPKPLEIKPVYIRNPAPKYPRLARRKRYQGTVVLDVLVDPEGKVSDLKLFKTSGYSVLDRAATLAVKKWQFRPGKRGDEIVTMWVRVPIRFQLR